MKQEQLKKLAEWAGVRLMTLEDETLAIAIPFQVNELEGNLPDKLWQPHEDSNQLDMLKKKWIKEAKINRIEYDLLQSSWWQATYYYGVDDDERYETEGEEINDCDINAILNYVEKK